MDSGIGLMAIDVQCAAPSQIEDRKRTKIVVISTPDDGAFALSRHDERQR